MLNEERRRDERMRLIKMGKRQFLLWLMLSRMGDILISLRRCVCVCMQCDQMTDVCVRRDQFLCSVTFYQRSQPPRLQIYHFLGSTRWKYYNIWSNRGTKQGGSWDMFHFFQLILIFTPKWRHITNDRKRTALLPSNVPTPLSPTHSSNYLFTPQEFLWWKFLLQPSRHGPAAMRDTALHVIPATSAAQLQPTPPHGMVGRKGKRKEICVRKHGGGEECN